MSSAKKTAIVTGASKGIGAAIATRLGRDGFGVVVGFLGDEGGAGAVVRGIQADGGRALALRADVRDPADVRRLFDEASRAFGGIDVLVNSAGILELAPLADMTDEAFQRVLDVNLRGTFNGMREAARRLRAGGRIVNLSSSVVGLLQPTYGAYAASKAAVEALTAVFAKELRGREITVNAVAPGPTATELFTKGKLPELVERLAKAPPLERLGLPEDVARVVSFLVGIDGSWVNGQVLRANGGLI